MYNRKIRFVWNVGGGTGSVTHPEILDAGNPYDETLWYRIEAERYFKNSLIDHVIYNTNETLSMTLAIAPKSG